MSYRIGKRYFEIECPLCSSVYLMLENEIIEEKIKMEPDPDDPNDDGTRYLYGFYCEDCNRHIRKGIFLGKHVCSDTQIENWVSEMKALK